MFPELFGMAEYTHHDPYTLHMFYDWENFLPSQYGEWWGYSYFYHYVIYMLFYIGGFVYVHLRAMDAERFQMSTMASPDFFDNNQIWGTIDPRSR